MSVIYINSYQFAAAAPPSGYDPDAAAYIARVEGASGDNAALETAVKDAINAFVVGCKADGIWNAIKASCILAGARTLNGALQPLVGTAPTNPDDIFTNSDYDRKTGLKGDGNPLKYLDTNRANNADPQNSKHLAVYRTEASTFNNTDLGTRYNVSGNSSLGRVGGVTMSYATNSAGLLNENANVAAIGLLGTSRSVSSNVVRRASGSNATLASTSATPIADSVLVFKTTNVSAASNSRLAYYSIGESLDLALLDARVTTLINAFAAAIP